MNNVIEIKKLTKKYDENFQLGEINLTIPSGTIVGIIGENGAGKTTLIKTILNIINADSGEIKIFGKNTKQFENVIKEDIGVVLDNMFFPEILTIKDINSCMRAIYRNWDSELFDKYLKSFSLPKNKLIKTLSKGMRKKLEIITALSHKPKLLILDEPTSGLDPVTRNDIMDIFLDFIKDDQHTIILSTHITTDLEHIADKIIFINEGKIVFDKERDELIDNYGILRCSKDDFKKLDKSNIISYKSNKYSYDVLIDNKNNYSKKLKGLTIDKVTLEEIMILILKGDKI